MTKKASEIKKGDWIVLDVGRGRSLDAACKVLDVQPYKSLFDDRPLGLTFHVRDGSDEFWTHYFHPTNDIELYEEATALAT